MHVTPFVHEGLGNSSYLVDIGDGRGLVVDPDRSIGRYMAAADAAGLEITAILETHLHADFVTGSRELQALGARLFAPAAGALGYGHHPLSAGERLSLDVLQVEAIASPGHTPEHLAYAVSGAGAAPLLFSGGSLIVGGAARTDLISPGQTETLTRAQFETVHSAFAALPDETVLYPTHGAGSFCSAGAGGERVSTLGQERRLNAVLLETDENAFVDWFIQSFPAAPTYFFRLRAVNQAGPRLVKDVPRPPALSATEFAAASTMGTVVDTRPQAQFMAGHVPGAVSIAFRPAFATWLGWLVDHRVPLYFVHGDEPLEHVLAEAMLVGHEAFGGYLAGGMAAWESAGIAVERHALPGPAEAEALLASGALAIDVREPTETFEHLPGAMLAPLGNLAALAERLPIGRPLLVYCGHGERSATGLSLLARMGMGPLYNLDGGFDDWSAAGLPVERRAVPSP
jgi:glyoxylase-like metal-dependent hydrolase (beta-lactamase superfamily II)